MPEILMDINTMSLEQLVDTRPDLVAAIESREHEIRIVTQVQKDGHGRISRWVEELRGPDGILTGRRVDEYTYYESGEINVIVQSVYDGEGALLSQKEVTHFKDGRQPVIKLK